VSCGSGRVSVVVLNYNGAEDTIECLESLRLVDYDYFNVVVVDNDSTDDSFEIISKYMQSAKLNVSVYNTPADAMVEPCWNDLVLVGSGVNGGYGAGNNIGSKYALATGADYVLILNNDTVVDPGFIAPLVRLCEEDPMLGIVSGKINYYDDPDRIWSLGGNFTFRSMKVKQYCFGELDCGQKPSENINFLSGCMWFIPKRTFEVVGFIKEAYFMYVEDVEFCMRVIKAGFHLDVSEESKVLHKVGSSSDGRFSSFSVTHRTINSIALIDEYSDGFISKVVSTFCFFVRYSYRLIREGDVNIYFIFVRSVFYGLNKK